jgi:hypothetical protein
MQPGFQFSFSPDLGIADARVSMMRFKVEDAPWRRFTAEADRSGSTISDGRIGGSAA